jgi:predicted PurR-regulated permease PerM
MKQEAENYQQEIDGLKETLKGLESNPTASEKDKARIQRQIDELTKKLARLNRFSHGLESSWTTSILSRVFTTVFATVFLPTSKPRLRPLPPHLCPSRERISPLILSSCTLVVYSVISCPYSAHKRR